MMKLSNEIVASIVTSVTNNSGVERSDKELFLLAYKEYKNVDKKARGRVTQLLNVQVEGLTKSTNVQNTLKRVFKVAYNYVDMSVICKFDSLEYSNITNLVKLFKYVDNNVADKADELRTTIKDVYDKDLSDVYYNNAMTSKIVELKEEYKLKDVDGEYKVLEFNDMYNTIKGSIDKYDKEQLIKLLALVEEQFDIVEADELLVA